ncbi:hypothetical protein AXG93_392s1170 [Marchantia polymorpha subsp. ruderalis]|uniref:Uncharacterized protein n=1 Tax=Marchantia polymorpha subsp. ruderalis TaxID=1480154 RepID=A0A176WQ73_MARPO|nr:hypothetical protein AXG93_392s1170 [Marchantia polymorpha subsp. ruderalis]
MASNTYLIRPVDARQRVHLCVHRTTMSLTSFPYLTGLPYCASRAFHRKPPDFTQAPAHVFYGAASSCPCEIQYEVAREKHGDRGGHCKQQQQPASPMQDLTEPMDSGSSRRGLIATRNSGGSFSSESDRILQALGRGCNVSGPRGRVRGQDAGGFTSSWAIEARLLWYPASPYVQIGNLRGVVCRALYNNDVDLPSPESLTSRRRAQPCQQAPSARWSPFPPAVQQVQGAGMDIPMHCTFASAAQLSKFND